MVSQIRACIRADNFRIICYLVSSLLAINISSLSLAADFLWNCHGFKQHSTFHSFLINTLALLKQLKSMHIFNQINVHGPRFNQIQLKIIKWPQIKDTDQSIITGSFMNKIQFSQEHKHICVIKRKTYIENNLLFETQGRQNCNFCFKGFANYMEMEKKKKKHV